MREQRDQFKFLRNENIGEPAAEEDQDYLTECFEDTGDLKALRDPLDKKCIVLGRTGAGKSALLLKFADSVDNCVSLDLEDTALNYLTNSTILKTLHDLKVNLDQFFKLLWKHVFIIELIKLKYPMRNKEETRSFFDRLRNRFSADRKKELAIKYLEEREDTFFETTLVRIKEMTGKLENSVQGSLGVKAAQLFSADISQKHATTHEEKLEVVHLAQHIVNEQHVTELNTLFGMMKDDLFLSTHTPYFILIDRLDEGWVEEIFRNRLIRSLLDTVRDFVKIPGVKIIVALRKDLIDRVFYLTSDPGTQREKYQSLYLNLSWSNEHLLKLLDRRVNRLVKRRYSSLTVCYTDLMPGSVGKTKIGDYIVERTLHRPRDIIMFFNACISKSINQPKVTLAMLREAETEYSKARLEAIYDEWRTDYPDLDRFTSILKGQPANFTVGSIDQARVNDLCLERSLSPDDRGGPLTHDAQQVVNADMSSSVFSQRLMSIFYRVGIVGLKTEKQLAIRWSFLQGADISYGTIDPMCGVSVCPAFHSALNVDLQKSR